jgi:hypothetical protein
MHVQHLQQKTWKPNRLGSAEYAQVPASPSSPLLSSCQATRDCGLGEARISSLGRSIDRCQLQRWRSERPTTCLARRAIQKAVQQNPGGDHGKLAPLAGRFLALVVINRLGRSDTAKTNVVYCVYFPALD